MNGWEKSRKRTRRRKSQSLYDAISNGSADEQSAAAFALVQYANSWTSGRVRQEELDYMLIAVDHKAALDVSAIALAQWENMIGVPIQQLETFYASGITPAELSKILFQAAGLSAIAVGVLK
jgi:hypothetical protein